MSLTVLYIYIYLLTERSVLSLWKYCSISSAKICQRTILVYCLDQLLLIHHSLHCVLSINFMLLSLEYMNHVNRYKERVEELFGQKGGKRIYWGLWADSAFFFFPLHLLSRGVAVQERQADLDHWNPTVWVFTVLAVLIILMVGWMCNVWPMKDRRMSVVTFCPFCWVGCLGCPVPFPLSFMFVLCCHVPSPLMRVDLVGGVKKRRKFKIRVK